MTNVTQSPRQMKFSFESIDDLVLVAASLRAFVGQAMVSCWDCDARAPRRMLAGWQRTSVWKHRHLEVAVPSEQHSPHNRAPSEAVADFVERGVEQGGDVRAER